MKINDRVRLVRKSFNMNQKVFGEKIVASQNYLSSIENGQRDVTEKIIKIICHEFNISEKWLRDGEGEMFLQKTVSLDEKAKQHNLSELEIEIVKGYMELPLETRKTLLDLFGSKFQHHAATVAAEKAEIEAELESYRKELEAEKRAKTLSAFQKRDEIS